MNKNLSWTHIALLALPVGVFSAPASAGCPPDVEVLDELTCSSSILSQVVHTDPSYLGGECVDEDCYTCGEPHADEEQVAPEAVYSFQCQLAGTVSLLITDLPCDLDIYVLDDTCDPYGGCLYGSTSPYADNDGVDFECTPGQIYYIVVEAYGTEHLDVASGPCTDDGTATGNVYSPTYTLSFDVSASTGCAEDCDDSQDNDLDGDIDCDDLDCWSEPLCCDHDRDGAISLDCNGDDCDDENASIYPGAPEDGGMESGIGDQVDNDCDGEIDEGTLTNDDDGDGFSEEEGDCDDDDTTLHPEAVDIPGNGIDEDCDGSDAEVEEDGDTGVDESKAEQGFFCACSARPGSVGSLGALLLLGGVALLRRRSTIRYQ